MKLILCVEVDGVDPHDTDPHVIVDDLLHQYKLGQIVGEDPNLTLEWAEWEDQHAVLQVHLREMRVI